MKTRYEKCLHQGQATTGDLKSRAKNIAKCMKLDMNNFKTGRTLVLYRAMEYRTMELKWSVSKYKKRRRSNVVVIIIVSLY